MRRLGKFRMTDHFLYRIWDRKVEVRLLRVILSQIEIPVVTTTLVVSRQVMKKEFGMKTKELFVVIDKTILVTCYFCDFNEYFKCRRNSRIVLIQEISNNEVA